MSSCASSSSSVSGSGTYSSTHCSSSRPPPTSTHVSKVRSDIYSVSGSRSIKGKGPCSIVPLEKESGNSHKIYTAPNGITEETILAVQGDSAIYLYCLKVTEKSGEDGCGSENEDEGGGDGEKPHDEKMKTELDLFHSIFVTDDTIACFALPFTCSVTLPPRRLAYAVAPFTGNHIFYLDFSEKDFDFPDKIFITGNGSKLQQQYEDNVQVFQNVAESTHLALNGEYIACILSIRVLVVWEIATAKKLYTFLLDSEGVGLLWHPSDPYKVLVAELNGYLKFLSLAKERFYMTQNLLRSPLYSCDWANTNSLICAVGWTGGFTTLNTSQCNTNMFNNREQQCKAIKRVLFSPMDEKTVATLESPENTVRFYRSFVANPIWSYTNEQIVDIAWMHGKNYLLALSNKRLFVFDAASPV